MATLSDTIPPLPMELPEFSADPDPFHAAALKQHPWLGRFAMGWAVHGYKANDELMADDVNLVPGLGPIVDFYGMRGTLWGRFMEEMLLTATGDFHKRLRASVSPCLHPAPRGRSAPDDAADHIGAARRMGAQRCVRFR